jgi:ABC-type branched-subunit amino acid transport system permease subunit
MVDVDFLLYVGTYFFMILTVAQGMALIIGYGRLHYLGFSVPMLVGGLSVSALTSRLAYFLSEMGGVSLLPWVSADTWIENSQANAELVSAFLGNSPLIGAGLVLLSLILAFLLAGVVTWVSAKPALELKPVYLAIFSYTLPSFFANLSLKFVSLGGGHRGVFVPDVFAFSTLDREIFFLVVSGLVALLGSLLNGRMVRRLTDRIGVGVDGMVLFFGGGIIGVIGGLYSLRYLFVVQANYSQMFWGWWPLLMLVFAGFGLGRRLLVSVFVVQLMRLFIVYTKGIISEYLFFPIAYFESMLLGLFMILGLLIYQKQVGLEV